MGELGPDLIRVFLEDGEGIGADDVPVAARDLRSELARGPAGVAHVGLQAVGALFGAFLLLGLWTPIAGTVVAMAGTWILLSSAGDSKTSAMVVVMGITLAMIGPGAWSIDARLFGRRHIQASEQ